MIKKALGALALLGFASLPVPALAQHGHYLTGLEGIRAGSLPTNQGAYWKMYNAFYNASTWKDNDGNSAAGKNDLSIYALVNRFGYVSSMQLWGGNVAFSVNIPLQYTSINKGGTKASRFDLADPSIEPFVVVWNDLQYDALAGLGIYFPAGNFDETKIASAGRGFWTVMLSGGGTYYFDNDRMWTASAIGRYEFNTKQKRTKITPGDDFHIEWSLAKKFDNNWELGATGYAHWQVTRDSGPSAFRKKERAYALGPEVIFRAVPHLHLDLSLRSQWEFASRNAHEGNLTTLTLIKAF